MQQGSRAPAVFLIFILFLSLLPYQISAAPGDNWTIDDSLVYVNDSRVYLSANPHTISSPGWVEFTLLSKQFTGDIDVAWGFSLPEVKPKKAQLYAPYWHNWTTEHSQDFYYVTAFTATEEACEYGYEYNTHHYNVSYSLPLYDDEGNVTGWQPTTSIICFDSYEHDGSNYTVTWQQQHSEYIEWVDFTGFEKLEYNHGGMNTWYLLKNVAVTAGETYKLRAWVDLPISQDAVQGKYWWCIKPSALSISEAIAQDKFYALDPWYDADWDYRKLITITNPTDETLTAFPVLINVSYEAAMQNDFEDCVFTDASSVIRPFELDYYADSSYALYWVNVSSIPGSGVAYLYMYYGNGAATSQEDVEATWNSGYVMVQHMSDGVDNAHITDSTLYSNDGTKKAANEPIECACTVGKAQDFDGTDDSITILNSGFEYLLNFTIEGFIYSSALGVSRPVLAKWNLGTSSGFNTWISSTNKLYIMAYVFGQGMEYNGKYSSNNINIGWNALAVSITSNPNHVDLILNGITTSYDGDRSGSVWGGHNIVLGTYKTTGSFLNGTIDEVRISNVARSADWIAASYEFVQNQNTYIAWGSEACYTCEPLNLTANYGNFWVNWTWDIGNCTGLDSFNVSINDTWYNGSTNMSYNVSTSPHEWINITVYGYNTTCGLSDPVSGQQQIPNHIPVISGCDNVTYDATGFVVDCDCDYTDADGDTCTFSDDFPYGSLDPATGEFHWEMAEEELGQYFVHVTVDDGYGGNDTCTITIGSMDILIYLQNLNIVEEQEMLGHVYLFIFLLFLAIVFMFTAFLSSNLTLKILAGFLSGLLFFVEGRGLLAGVFGEQLEMAWLSTILTALGIVMAIFTLLSVISVLYMMLKDKSRAGMTNLPYDPDADDW